MIDAKRFAEGIKLSFEKKANHNKMEALLCFTLILVSSLSAPLFINIGKNDLLSKIIPSILSVIAAGLTSWIQLRKPQRLWGIYRGAQRRVEFEITKHEFGIGDYKENAEADALLAERVGGISMTTHSEWTEVIPTSEDYTRSAKL
jgi:hypothetical protein